MLQAEKNIKYYELYRVVYLYITRSQHGEISYFSRKKNMLFPNVNCRLHSQKNRLGKESGSNTVEIFLNQDVKMKIVIRL